MVEEAMAANSYNTRSLLATKCFPALLWPRLLPDGGAAVHSMRDANPLRNS